MPSTKPTIVLVHGAFHRSVCFDKIKQRLEALSYPVTTVDSPTTNGSSLTTTYKDDVEAIHQVMLPLMDEGKEIVIVGHSLGGISACASTEGESIAERATAGKKGGIRSIVFICAFALPKIGLICPEYNTPADNSWAELNAVSRDPIFWLFRNETDSIRMDITYAMTGLKQSYTKTFQEKKENSGLRSFDIHARPPFSRRFTFQRLSSRFQACT